MSNQVQAVKFYDDTLITLEKDGEHYVAVRPIVENMGLDWGGQQKKLTENEKFNCRHISTVAKDGKIREVLCMPIKKLNGWLFSINPEKVRSDIRHIVEQYQEECFAVLHDYWHKGVAVNERADVAVMPTKLSEMTPLPRQLGWGGTDNNFRNALHMMISQVAGCYINTDKAYRHVEHHLAYLCGVDSPTQISRERLPTALQALSFMAREAIQHKQMMTQVDNNGLMALAVKTSTTNVHGFLE